MTDLPKARRIARKEEWSAPADRVALDYEGRFLRRKALTCEGGLAFLAVLERSESLDEGDAFVLEDGRCVEVAAADEPLFRVTGDLARLAWHVGSWRAPCVVGAKALIIRRDPALAALLRDLGARLEETEGPFRPEAGGRAPGRGAARVRHHAFRHSLARDGEGEEPQV